MSTKKLQILGALGNAVNADTVDGKHASDFAAASDVSELHRLIGDTPVSEQIASAVETKADKDHTHTNLQLHDVVSGSESIDINAAEPQHPLNITLTSETYNDFSNITVVLASENGEQSAMADSYGVVSGLNAESAFTLSLRSDVADFDPSKVVISCEYILDLNQVIQDHVLHVDISGGDDSGDGGSINTGSVVIDETLSLPGAAADAKATGDAINLINSKIADILYEEIAISNFTNNINTAEKGSTVDTVILNWTTNKTPESIILDGENLDVTLTTYTDSSLGLKENKNWSLSVTDDRGATASKSTGISFLNGVYYGAASEPASYNSDFILSLKKQLSREKVKSFTVTSGAGQYVYYCLPVNMGACLFNVGGFDGGVTLVSTIEFTNAYNHTENYYIYRSDNANLGTKLFKVS